MDHPVTPMMLDRTTPVQTCIRIEDMRTTVERGYERIALASHRRHLTGLDPADGGLLIVSADWLFCQECLQDGWAAVYFEVGLLEWDCGDLDRNLLIRANDWMFDGDEDLTLFRGASLGRAFTRDFNLFLYHRSRLGAALRDILARSGAKEITLFDYQVDYFSLDQDEVRRLVEVVATEAGADFADRSDPLSAEDPAAPLQPGQLSRTPGLLTPLRPTWRDTARRAIETVAGWISRLLAAAAGNGPRVLCCLTQLNSIRLLERLPVAGLRPILFARLFPNKRDPKFVLGRFLRGASVRPLPPSRLSPHDREALAKIVERLRQSWASKRDDDLIALCRHAETHVVESGILEAVAREALACEHLLDRVQPDAFFTDSYDGPAYGILAAMAKKRGITTFHTWHGQYTQNLRIFMLGGDPRVPASIDCCLTWGIIHERWLKENGFTGTVMRTGSMVVPTMIPTEPADARLAALNPERADVLILQYTPGRSDIRGLDERQYASFVEIVRMLRRQGFRNIRMRLHPGAWRTAYFERISDLFDLNCTVEEGGPFHDSVSRADLVIGPAQSGAMVETIAHGKPYYPIVMAPHSLDPASLDIIHPYRTLDALEAAVKTRTVTDQPRILAALSGRDGIDDPAERALETIASIIEKPRHEERL